MALATDTEDEMEAKHTPGPWVTSNNWEDTNARPWEIWSEPDGPLASTSRFLGEIKSEADARLAATAPDLLDALVIVCRALGAWRNGGDINLEGLKYHIVDRAIEYAVPGFDGGTTSAEELRENMAAWRIWLTKAEGRES